MPSKVMTAEQVVGRIQDGMTVGIGGWGSRRKPMALVREILRSDLKDLTIVSYAGPDVGLLLQAGKASRVVFAFATLDSIPLEPLFSRARQEATASFREWDEGMFQTGLRAAAQRVPFLPMRAGLGSAVLENDPTLRTVVSPYDDGQELVAVPALELDVALVHMNRADQFGNAQYLGPDPYFDDLFCMAAKEAYVSTEQVIDTAGMTVDAAIQTMLINRTMVAGVVETPNGAHFTTCTPTYERDEKFQKAYATAAKTPEDWAAFEERFLSGSEQDYQDAVAAFAKEAVMTDVTRAEYCAVAIADCFADDGEIMGSPMGLLPSLGARLAKLTSNPLLMITDGESRILQGAPPLGVTQDVVEGWMPFRLVLESVVPYGKRHVMMGATQIDREGNQNISAIGEWAQPKRQLLGVRGAPGNTVNNKTSYWVPKHSSRVFVEQVDIVSGVGRTRAEAAGPAATRFHQVHRVVSDLGVFDFEGPGHTMRFVSVHPGVTVDDVQAASALRDPRRWRGAHDP